MLDITFITIHPAMIDAYRQLAIFRRAEEKGLARLRVVSLRDFAVDHHGTVDGRPCGGGDGMVLRADCLGAAVDSLGGESQVVLPSPRGARWSDSLAREMLTISKPLVFVCGRFGGVDQRFIDRYTPQEISLGDFIVSGGELPALTIVDTLLRLIPGVLGHEESAQVDSFSPAFGGCLEFPLYTKPREIWGMTVPEVLMSGDHQGIAKWRTEKSREVTAAFRPDLIKKK
jgi:tRNA (guanine37-N1)-methyltransferase